MPLLAFSQTQMTLSGRMENTQHFNVLKVLQALPAAEWKGKSYSVHLKFRIWLLVLFYYNPMFFNLSHMFLRQIQCDCTCVCACWAYERFSTVHFYCHFGHHFLVSCVTVTKLVQESTAPNLLFLIGAND